MQYLWGIIVDHSQEVILICVMKSQILLLHDREHKLFLAQCIPGVYATHLLRFSSCLIYEIHILSQHHSACVQVKNGMQLKTYGLFTSRLFHFILSWMKPWGTTVLSVNSYTVLGVRTLGPGCLSCMAWLCCMTRVRFWQTTSFGLKLLYL